MAREHTHLDRAHGRLDELARRRTADLATTLAARARRVGELGQRAARDADHALATRQRRIATHGQHHLERAVLTLAGHESVVRALDPKRVLERGYSITRDVDGRVLRDVEGVGVGAMVETELAGGRMVSRVETLMEEPGA
jgi:exodeoxyribonuclease VII large subunit